jgi:hypothetical protein
MTIPASVSPMASSSFGSSESGSVFYLLTVAEFLSIISERNISKTVLKSTLTQHVRPAFSYKKFMEL